MKVTLSGSVLKIIPLQDSSKDSFRFKIELKPKRNEKDVGNEMQFISIQFYLMFKISVSSFRFEIVSIIRHPYSPYFIEYSLLRVLQDKRQTFHKNQSVM